MERTSDEGVLEPIAWDAPGRGVLSAYTRTLVDCLLHPLLFFRRVALSEDRWSALGFAMITHVLGFSAAALWLLLLPQEPGELTLGLIRVVLAPLWVLASVWIGSELMHGFLSLFGGAKRSRSMTHRAVAFCYATASLGVVPVVGLRVGLFAALVYQAIALKQVHRVHTGAAVAAVVATWVVLIGGVLLLAGGAAATEGGPS